MCFTCREVEGGNVLEYIAKLYTVGSYVLNSCGSGSTGDVIEVFNTPKTLLSRPPDRFRPILSGSNGNKALMLILEFYLYSLQSNMKNKAINVFGKEDIAPSTKNNWSGDLLFCPLDGIYNVLGGVG